MALVLAGGCTVQAPVPEAPLPGESPEVPAGSTLPTAESPVTAPSARNETDALLDLTAEVMAADTPRAQRAIEGELERRFETEPSHANLLRLSMARALTARLPAELKTVRADLQTLANGDAALTDGQRQLARLTLTMVEERLTLGNQITELRRQIESLTEIEASLNPPATERTP